jgi:hypothetical protein
MVRPTISAGTVLILVALLLSCVSVVASSSSSCDPACNFTLPAANESTCRVYGGAAAAVPFYRANASCLEAYKVLETRLTLEELLITCPNADGSGAEPVRLLSILRGDNGDDNFGNRSQTEVDYVKGLFPNFFQYNNATGHYELMPVVSDRLGQQVDCSASLAICWEVINIFLSTSDEGAERLVEICRNLRDRFRRQSEREQGEIRRILCGLTEAPPSVCEPLASQVRDVAANSTSLSCDALATPTNLSDVPKDCQSGDGTDGGQDGGTSGAHRSSSNVITIALISAVVLFLGQM